MPALKLKLPPGFFANGTDYAGAGRYIRGNLVRWVNGFITPILGWRPANEVSYPLGTVHPEAPPLWSLGADAARSGIVVSDDVGPLTTYIGTSKQIYQMSGSRVISIVTPSGFAAQNKDADFDYGYGMFRYSYGQYGTPRPTPRGLPPAAFSWGFDNWGAWAVACAREVSGASVYIKTDTDSQFVAISNSPQGAHDIVVTDERFLMTTGKRADYRLVEWSDRENYNLWTPAGTNEAGNYRLQGNGKLVAGVRVLNQVLIIGENDAFVARYVGPPYVYGFTRIGDRCGISGPNAVAVTGFFAMWMDGLKFWLFDGSLREVPCEILDYFERDRDAGQQSKTSAFSISGKAEVWFLYQSNDSTTNEVDSYLIYNMTIGKWYFGRIDRTMGIDNDPLIYVCMIGTTGIFYDHEVEGAGRDGLVPWIETGPLEVEDGTRLLGCAYVLPDARTSEDVQMTLSVRDHAQAKNPRYSKTFQLTDPTSTTGILGRDIRMRLEGTLVNPNWVIGDFRVEPTKVPGPIR